MAAVGVLSAQGRATLLDVAREFELVLENVAQINSPRVTARLSQHSLLLKGLLEEVPERIKIAQDVAKVRASIDELHQEATDVDTCLKTITEACERMSEREARNQQNALQQQLVILAQIDQEIDQVPIDDWIDAVDQWHLDLFFEQNYTHEIECQTEAEAVVNITTADPVAEEKRVKDKFFSNKPGEVYDAVSKALPIWISDEKAVKNPEIIL